MIWLPDTVIDRLRAVVDEPDLSGTPYQMVRLLARGGMGTVYLVHDSRLGREVALKVLHSPDPGAVLTQRLAREARVLARLDHASIAPVYDVGTLADGRVYYTMRRVQGRQLDDWARDTPTVPAKLRVLQKVCEAVAFAHARGVVHRDLKPENVMVGAFGEALVMDWGAAKLLAAGPVSPAEGRDGAGPKEEASGSALANGATLAGTIIGTPSYMSPEQARGDAQLVDERTDVYALGAILHFLLAGKPPFEGASVVEILHRVQHDPPVPIRHLDRRMPRPLESICLKALAKAPADRYATAAEMAADLDRFLDGLPVLAHHETVPQKALRVLARHRALALLVLAYLLMRIVLLLAARR